MGMGKFGEESRRGLIHQNALTYVCVMIQRFRGKFNLTKRRRCWANRLRRQLVRTANSRFNLSPVARLKNIPQPFGGIAHQHGIKSAWTIHPPLRQIMTRRRIQPTTLNRRNAFRAICEFSRRRTSTKTSESPSRITRSISPNLQR